MIRRKMKVLVERELRFKPVKLALYNYDKVCFKVRGQKEEEVITKLIRHAVSKYDIPIEKILSGVPYGKRERDNRESAGNTAGK